MCRWKKSVCQTHTGREKQKGEAWRWAIIKATLPWRQTVFLQKLQERHLFFECHSQLVNYQFHKGLGMNVNWLQTTPLTACAVLTVLEAGRQFMLLTDSISKLKPAAVARLVEWKRGFLWISHIFLHVAVDPTVLHNSGGSRGATKLWVCPINRIFIIIAI